MRTAVTTASSCRWRWRKRLAEISFELRHPSIPIGCLLIYMLLGLAVIGLATVRFSSSGSPVVPFTTGTSAASAVGFAFKSAAFDNFVCDSYRIHGGNPHDFYRWFESSFQKAAGTSKDEFLAMSRSHIQSLKGKEQVFAEMQLATSLHSIVRKMLPVFSLERGFEFAEAERHGKRQCLLQSVLISSLLQKAGLQSGIVMIFRKWDGETSNNGHNVAMLRLSDGTDVLVDASHREPFVDHRGLFVRNSRGGYLYIDPIYSPSQHGVITGYKKEASHAKISGEKVAVLDNAFIDSQFDYYRAERTEHGVMDRASFRSGVNKSIEYLKSSLQKCPDNPLPVYMLGRAYRMNGDVDRARVQYRRAWRMYSEYGWVPESVRSARI